MLVSAAIGISCSSRATVFVCRADSQCTVESRVGVCEPSGYCSFPDTTCPQGRRHGTYAGVGLGQRCVDPPACGNGRQDPGEDCDDGNQVNDDGCTAGCVRCEAREGGFAWGRDGRCYLRRDEALSWDDAQRGCVRRGAHLAVLSTPEETEAVCDALLPAVSATLWVGLREGDEPARYRWLTREPEGSVVWHAGYPRGYGGKRGCGAVARGSDGRAAVADDRCETPMAHICERAPIFVNVATGGQYHLVADTLSRDEADGGCADLRGRVVRFETDDERTLILRRFGGDHWLGDRSAAGDCLVVGADQRVHVEPCDRRHPVVCEIGGAGASGATGERSP